MSPTQPLLQHFSHIKDPRIKRTQLHPLENILTIAICAVICGAENWTEIEDFAYAKEEFFSQIIDLSNGIPSHDTFGRVFAALDPRAFAEGFTVSDWSDDIVAIDGKAMRRSLDKANGIAAVHLVSAFSAHNRLVLGQVKVGDKSNEITAIPELLKHLTLSGCLVTLDAMECQRKITSNIREAGADYVLSLKGNQRELFDDTQRYFDWCENHPEKKYLHDDTDAGHGRVERRVVETVDVEWLAYRVASQVNVTFLLQLKCYHQHGFRRPVLLPL
ncbi:ISAs1 family transposase [Salmonella enterica subsp. enterica serovar Ramatgan]|nr:ISAs1 family transposase [Salmonella enterica subsp. enterica serovar Ramatgan]